MCLRVTYATCTIERIYDAEHGVITVPADLPLAATRIAVRAALAGLCISQDLGAPTCWCGAVVDLSGRVPAQRTGEAIRSGA